MPGITSNPTKTEKQIQEQEIKHEKELIKDEKNLQEEFVHHQKESSKKEKKHHEELLKKEKKLIVQHNKEEREKMEREKELERLQAIHDQELARTQQIADQTIVQNMPMQQQIGFTSGQTAQVVNVPLYRTEEREEIIYDNKGEVIYDKEEVIYEKEKCEQVGGLKQPIFSVQHPLTVHPKDQQNIQTDKVYQTTYQTNQQYHPSEQAYIAGEYKSDQFLPSGQVTQEQKPGFIQNIKHGIEKFKAEHYDKKEQECLEKAVQYGAKADEAAIKASQIPHS